jgi:E3 ubiquitin-protein ligase RNF14
VLSYNSWGLLIGPLDPTNVHCPILCCQAIVLKPESCDDESPWTRLRTCPSCSFSFCVFCRRSWSVCRPIMCYYAEFPFRHGPISSCPTSSAEVLVEEYLAFLPGSREREVLEQRFGRRYVLELAQKYEDERINKERIKETTTPCPGCGVRVEKSSGCNHVRFQLLSRMLS